MIKLPRGSIGLTNLEPDGTPIVSQKLLDEAAGHAAAAKGRIDGDVQNLEFVRRRVAGDGETRDALDAGR